MKKLFIKYLLVGVVIITCVTNSTTLFAQSVTITNLSGIAPSPVYTGQTQVALIGFSVKNTSASSFSIKKFADLICNGFSTTTYLANVTLYRSTVNNAYPNASYVSVGTVTPNGGSVSLTNLNETIAAGATNYYYVAADDIYAGGPNYNVQPYFNYSNNFITLSTNATIGSINNYSGYQFTTPPPPTIVMNKLTGGVAAGPNITYGQTNQAVYGFSVNISSATTITNINLQSTSSNLLTYFTGKLYRNTTDTYGTGTATQVGTLAFNGSNINITGLNEAFTSGQTKYYFLVVDDIYYTSSEPQVRFYFSYGSNVLVTSTGYNVTNMNEITSATYTLKIPAPTVTVTGYNSAVNGITQGSLTYGQTNIVLFGFKLDVLGVITLNQILLSSNIAADNFFKNGKLYRSTDQYFSHATPVSGNFAFNTSTTISGVNEVFTNYTTPTTYYYFIVADLTAQPYFTPGTFQYNFASGNNSFASTNNTYFSGITTTNGTAFNVVNSVIWKGTVSGSFQDAANFTDRQGYNVSLPLGSSVVVQIGVQSYTNAPVITGNTNIGGITFGTISPPTLSIANGATLTVNSALNVINAANANITGPGNLVMANTSTSTIGPGATLNLSGALKASNAGTFIMTSTSRLNLTGNANLSNTGTFTLRSDATGSATIGPLSGTSVITGSYDVERFMTGNNNLLYRGYRLLSSSVSDPASTSYYNMSFLKGTGTFLTGAADGGFDVMGNPTIYLYRDDIVPTTVFAAGNYRIVSKIDNSPAYTIRTIDGNKDLPVGTGFMFFYRGNNGTLTTTAPSNVTLKQTGPLNQGPITVKNWTNGANTLSYSEVAGTTAVQGFNLIGNPYASSIDWNTHYDNSATNNGTGIYAPSVGHAIYIYNATTKNYSVYTSISASDGLASGSPGGTNIIPAGQGFFVRATSASAKVIFNESAKVTTQVTGSNLLLGAPVVANNDQHLRLELSKDSINKDQTVIAFNKSATTAYNQNEDVLYLKGSGILSLANLSSDKKALAINQLALPTAKQSQKIKLNIAGSSGIYQLNLTEVKNIPELYEVWLMDAYKKDSLDIKHNPTYNFNVNTNDTASTSANRFTLVIRQNAAYAYRLLDFAAKKVAANVEITWKTENEADYTYFTVERSTDGGKTFNILASEPAAGQGTYSILDKNPASGVNIYRLKQEDINGVVSYSQKVRVDNSNVVVNTITQSISLFPNPTNATLNVALKNTTQAASAYSIIITNSVGRVIKTVIANQTTWQGDVSTFLPGTYFVKVINEKDKTLAGNSTFLKL